LFNKLTDNHFAINQLLTFNNFLMFIGLWLVISLVGGSYPAFVMSKMPALGLMKRWTGQNNLSEAIRKGLVIFQFTCSVVLIIGVVIMNRQMRYISDKDLGYHPENVLSVPVTGISSFQQLETLKLDFSNLAGTKGVAAVQTFPGEGESGKNIYKPGATGEGLPLRTNSVYNPVVSTLGLDLIAGNDLPETISKTDSTGYLVINEVVAAYLGYSNPQDAVGKKVESWMKNSEITGVVRNFNFGSLKENVGAYAFYRTNQPSEGYYYLLLNYGETNPSTYLAQV